MLTKLPYGTEVHRTLQAFENGIRSHRFKRVLPGVEAPPHSSPWLGFIRSAYCGAFLINLKDSAWNSSFVEGSSDIAITAAHCVTSFRPENYYVSFGKHDYWVEKETNQMDVKVVKAIIHSDYIRESRYDDIAMLKLERPVKFSTFVRPITLSNFTLAELDHCFISGWGGTNKLRIANINKTHLIERDSGIIVDDLDDNPIPVEDGDSGSPLVCSKGNQFVAQGIVSGWTYRDQSFIFVNILSKHDWILSSFDEIESPMNYHPAFFSYKNVQTFDKSMLEKLLNHYIAGVFGYVPDNFKSKLNLEVNYDQYWKRWLEPEFYKDIHLKFDRFYIHGIVGYEFVHNVSTCAVLCVDKNYGRICNYLFTTKQCFFSVETNYQLNAAARMPLGQSLIIYTHSMDTTASAQVKLAPQILPVGNRIPNLELFAPDYNASISTQKSPMFHCFAQIWHRERSYLNTVLDKSPTCLTMLAPEYGGYLEMTLTDLNSPTEIRFEITYARTRKRWPIDRPILAMNYTVAEFPAFQSYNPLLGSFLAEPNTMPWIVDLEDGYAVLLNESEITGVGRKDRTRFILTTCNQKKQMERQINATVGSYFKELAGHFQQIRVVQHKYPHPQCQVMNMDAYMRKMQKGAEARAYA